jgi:hypothetical protein
LFDAIAAACGHDLGRLTKSEGALIGKIAAELRDAGAEPFDVQRRAARWPEVFGNATLTPSALSKWWSKLASNGTTAGALDAEPVEPPDEVFVQ